MKWLRPTEVTNCGVYIMQRTNDRQLCTLTPNEAVLVVLVNKTICTESNERLCLAEDPSQHLDQYDDKFRFFGPLPECV